MKTITHISGEFAVGAVDLMLPPRGETKGEAPNGLFARVYYPVNKVDEEKYSKKIDWAPRPEYNDLSAYGMVINFLYGRVVRNAQLNICWHAPLAEGEKELPIVVFSHGYMNTRFGYTAMCSLWAAQGYVVFALEHKDSTPTFTYQLMANYKGEMVERVTAHRKLVVDDILKREDPYITSMIFTRARECVALLATVAHMNGEALCSLVDTDFDWTQFVGRLDVDRAVMVGHSMGSCTALYTMAITDKFIAGFAYDGPLFPLFEHDGGLFDSLRAHRRPIVMMQCDRTMRDWLDKKRKTRRERAQMLQLAHVSEVVINDTMHGIFADHAHFVTSFPRTHLYGAMPVNRFVHIVDDIQMDLLRSVVEGGETFPSKGLRGRHGHEVTFTEAHTVTQYLE